MSGLDSPDKLYGEHRLRAVNDGGELSKIAKIPQTG
jgi:hypothetical protein